MTRPLGATHRVACHFPLEPAGQAVVIPDGPVPSDAVLVVERTSEPTAREFARD